MLKKITSIILSLALTLTAVFTGVYFGSKTEDTFAGVPIGFNEAMIKNSCKYLGFKYTWGGKDPAGGGFDCTGFALRALSEMGVGGAPWYTGGAAAGGNVNSRDMGGWLYKVTHRTLSLTYGGQYYGYNPVSGSHTNVVYTTTAAEFGAASNNPDNTGKLIVLAAEIRYGDLERVAKPGTFMVFAPCDNNGDGIADAGAHIAIALNHVEPNDAVKALTAADARSVAYAEQVFEEFGHSYRTYSGKPAYIGFQNGYVSKYRYITGTYKSTGIFNGNMPFYLIANHGQPGMENASDGIGTTLWRIEATTSTSSVALTNKTGGSGVNSPVCAFYFNDGKPNTNGKIGITTEDEDNSYLSGTAYAFTTSEEVAKNVAEKGMKSDYHFAAPSDDLNSAYVAVVIDDNKKTSFVTLPTGTEQERKYYVAQLKSKDDYDRDLGYYEIKLAGTTADNGIGASVKECIYHPAEGDLVTLKRDEKGTSTLTNNKNESADVLKVINKLSYIPREDNPYPDVPDDAWYTDDVIYAYEQGAMTGFGDGTFGPNKTIKRDETITVFWKMEGKPDVDIQEPSFLDTKLGKWNSKPIEWGKHNEILTGYTTGEFAGCFRPNTSINRQQFIKILYKYAQLKHYNVSVKDPESYKAVSDYWHINKYAVESMNWAYETGLIGVNSKFKPHNNITRAEAATIIARFLRTEFEIVEEPEKEEPTDTDEPETEEPSDTKEPEAETPDAEEPSDSSTEDESQAAAISHIVCAGDSITYGYPSKVKGSRWWEVVESTLGIETTLSGKSGAGMSYWKSNNACKFAWDTDFTNYDVAIYAFGTNDYGNDIPLGTINDTFDLSVEPSDESLTFYAAVSYVVQKVKEKNPDCKLILCLPINRTNTTIANKETGSKVAGSVETNWAYGTPNNLGNTLNDYCNAMVDVCEKYGVSYIDLRQGAFTAESLKDLLCDGVHPTEEGYEILAKEMCDAISAIIK